MRPITAKPMWSCPVTRQIKKTSTDLICRPASLDHTAEITTPYIFTDHPSEKIDRPTTLFVTTVVGYRNTSTAMPLPLESLVIRCQDMKSWCRKWPTLWPWPAIWPRTTSRSGSTIQFAVDTTSSDLSSPSKKMYHAIDIAAVNILADHPSAPFNGSATLSFATVIGYRNTSAPLPLSLVGHTIGTEDKAIRPIITATTLRPTRLRPLWPLGLRPIVAR